MDRKEFLKKAGTIGIMIGVAGLPLSAFAREDLIKLTILHTNDVHSHIDPLPMDHRKFPGMGGAARRKALVERIRSNTNHVLLLDAGDFFQGTPYFNVFSGELEMKLMSEMQYDAATIGNHDFDAGIGNLAHQLKHASFPLLSSNYDFSDTPMEGKSRPYKIFRKGSLKIGVFGLGVELEGIVPEKLYGATRYLDPIRQADIIATKLKQDKKCDVVICLSHLGYTSKFKGQVNDQLLAAQTQNIDVILGGHSHTFLEEPVEVVNLNREKVLISQMGYMGVYLGQIDLFFTQEGRLAKGAVGKGHLIR